MDMTQHKIKEIIGKTVEECRQTWLTTPRELQEVLISLAGDLAVEDKERSDRKEQNVDALEFITEVDSERGDGWQGDLGLLVHKFEEYAAIKVKEAASKSLSKFWIENYVGDDHLCVLCRNEGTIHTEHGSYYCICPNGRDMNKWK